MYITNSDQRISTVIVNHGPVLSGNPTCEPASLYSRSFSWFNYWEVVIQDRSSANAITTTHSNASCGVSGVGDAGNSS
jgi:hypothetical protein